MEAAAVLENQRSQMHNALVLCAIAKTGDPRTFLAGQRIARLGNNSEIFRQERKAIETLAGGNSECRTGAQEALYEAALDGLPQSNVRMLSERAGWLTKWNIARSSTDPAKSIAEQFEFADARIHLPDYLPAWAGYAAETNYVAPTDGQYVLTGDLAGTKISIDHQELGSGPFALEAGPHRVQILFRGADSAPRIRIVAFSAIDEKVFQKLSSREASYVRAAVALGSGYPQESAEMIRQSELAGTVLGAKLLENASLQSAPHLESTSAEAIPMPPQPGAPDSLLYAQWLAAHNRDLDAIETLTSTLRAWPLDREAHRMLIAELQRVGNNLAADRAAAEFLAIAPNARNLRRMAHNASLAQDIQMSAPFYAPYRRPAPAALVGPTAASDPVVILLQDKVAIARADGSVSLYMHRVVQLMTAGRAQMYRPLTLPEGAHLLTMRVVTNAAQLATLPPLFQAGDEIEEEYVVNYTGDGGMISHPEAFQYVFNDFNSPLLDARFVVLSPSSETPGYVIASGKVPASRVESVNGLRAEIWERKTESTNAATAEPAIVRVVENEHGWSIPPSVERRRILETIHPGPRPREA